MLAEIPTLAPDIARPIVEKWGGKSAIVADTGLPRQTIDSWERTGDIPEKYRPRLLVLAQRLGKPITPFDFIAYMVDIRIAA